MTYAWLEHDPKLSAFFSVCIKKERQSDFSGKTVADGIFEDDTITTVHLKWLAVRKDLERRKIGSIMMGRVVEDAYTIITKAGAHAVTVRYMGTASERIYRKFGFDDYGIPGQNKLYLPAQAVIDAVEA